MALFEDGESVNETFRFFEDDCVAEWRTDFDLRSTSKRGKKRSHRRREDVIWCQANFVRQWV
jgi:hypothetical protein